MAVLFATFVGILWPGSLLGEIPRFAFTGLPATITNETAFSVTIEARDIAGGRRTDISGRHRLAAYSRPWAGLIITELADNGGRIEVMNAGVEPLDVGGYSLSYQYAPPYNRPSGPGTAVDFVLPPDRILAPGQVFVLLSPQFGTNAWPPIQAYYRPDQIKLRDPEGRIVDEMIISNASQQNFSGVIYYGLTLHFSTVEPEYPWIGGPVFGGSSWYSTQRIGSELRASSQEWRVAPETLGQINPLLITPRSGWRSAAGITPESIVFTNGVWSGRISIKAPAGVVTMAVDDGGGRLSESGAISMIPLPPLALTVETMSAPASESAPGAFATLKVSRPDPFNSAIVVNLRSDYPGEITVPESVLIPAGEESATFAATNLDDAIPDGRALVTITASAGGLTDAVIELTNDDDEHLRATLIIPSELAEGSGRSLVPGWIHLQEPARHPVEVRLATTNNLLRLPSRVVIPAGMQAASFSFAVRDDAVANPSRGLALVTALVGQGEPASTAVRLLDNEHSAWVPAYPAVVREGAPEDITLGFYYPSDVPRRVGVLAGSPWIAPGDIWLPAGATNISIPLLYPTNGVRNPGSPPRIQAWVDAPPAGEADPALFQQVDVIDTEPAISDVIWNLPPVLSPNRQVPVRIVLADGNYPAAVNMSGRLRILSPGKSVRFTTGDEITAAFTNGVFESSVSLEGSGSGIEFEFSAGDITRRFGPTDVFEHWAQEGAFLDIAAIPGTARLIASAGSLTDAGGLLVEIDAATRAVVRSLPLPSPVIKIAITPDGSAAWCGDAGGAFRRINLAHWQAGEAVSVRSEVDSSFSLSIDSLIAMGGPSDRVIATMTAWRNGYSNAIIQPIHLENGTRILGAFFGIDLPYDGIRNVATGRTADEFYMINRTAISSSVIRLAFNNGQAMISPRSWIANRLGDDSLSLANGRLWIGSGFLDAQTLQQIQPPRNPGLTNIESIAVFPTMSRIDVISGNRLVAFSGVNGVLLGGHALNGAFSTGDRLLGTAAVGDRWLARLVGGSAGGRLYFSESPFPRPDGAPADIAIRVVENAGQAETGERMIELRNLGPGPALGCTVEVRNGSRTNFVEYGYLAAGRSQTNRVPMPRQHVGVGSALLEASSFATDPNPANNAIRLSVANYPAGITDMRPVFVQVQHMVASTDGNKIYAAVRGLPDMDRPGVVEIDPAAGVITRAIAIDDPLRVAIAGTNALLVRSGPEKLTRWNFSSGAITPEATVTNAVFFDFAAIPGEPDRVVVGAPDGISMFRNGELLAKTALRATERRVIAVVRDRVWTAFQQGFDAVPYTATGFGQPFYQSSGLWTTRDLIPAGDLLYVATWAVSAVIQMDDMRFRSMTLPTIIVPDARQHCVFTWSNGIVRLDERTFARTAYEPRAFPGTNQMTMLLRWGDAGFAMTDVDGYLHLFESGIVNPDNAGLSRTGKPATEPDVTAARTQPAAGPLPLADLPAVSPPQVARAATALAPTSEGAEPPSILLLDAVTGPGDPLFFGLSRSSQTPITAACRIQLVSANGAVTNLQFGTVQFPPRTTTASLSLGIPVVPFHGTGGRASIIFFAGDIANLNTTFQAEVTNIRSLSGDWKVFHENDEGISEATISITMSAVAPVPVEVNYEVAIEGTATNVASGRLRFQPGQTNNIVSFPLVGNRVFERDRTITIRLFQSWNAALAGGGNSFAQLVENDPIPQPRASIQSGPDGSLRIRFRSEPHVHYNIQYAAEVTNLWTMIDRLVEPPDPVEFLIETNEAVRFYRVIGE